MAAWCSGLALWSSTCRKPRVVGSTPTVVANSFFGFGAAAVAVLFETVASLSMQARQLAEPRRAATQRRRRHSCSGHARSKRGPLFPFVDSPVRFVLGLFLSPDCTAFACLLVLTCTWEGNLFRRLALANARVEPVHPPIPNGLASWTDPPFLFEACR